MTRSSDKYLHTEPGKCSGEIGAQKVPLDGHSGGQSELPGAGNRQTRLTCTWDVIRGGDQETLAGRWWTQRAPAAHARRRGHHHYGLTITSSDRCDPANRTIALKRCCRHHLTTVGVTPRRVRCPSGRTLQIKETLGRTANRLSGCHKLERLGRVSACPSAHSRGQQLVATLPTKSSGPGLESCSQWLVASGLSGQVNLMAVV